MAGLAVLYAQQVYMREQLDKYLPEVYCAKFELDKIVVIVEEKTLAKADSIFQKMQESLSGEFNDTTLVVYITRDSFVLDEFPKQFQNLINIRKYNIF